MLMLESAFQKYPGELPWSGPFLKNSGPKIFLKIQESNFSGKLLRWATPQMTSSEVFRIVETNIY